MKKLLLLLLLITLTVACSAQTRVSWKMVKDTPFVDVTDPDYGADPTGVADSTAAFNLATRATEVHGGNGDLNMRAEIYVPPGDYLIDGTVYVRKGQHLRGAGQGATRIITSATSTGRYLFVTGRGLIGGTPTADPGGMPSEISGLNIFGSDLTGGGINVTGSGASAHDLFITSAATSIFAEGGDILIYDVTIDQALNGIVLEGQNIKVSNALFYVVNYGISLGTCYDVEIDDCHVEYYAYSGIVVPDTTTVKNVTVSNSTFVMNEQYVTGTGGVYFRANSSDMSIVNCSFRNSMGYGVNSDTGVSSNISVTACVFDGVKTNPAYAQSTTAGGVHLTNASGDITNNVFRNLLVSPILIGPRATTAVSVRVIGNTFVANSAAITETISISGTGGSLYVKGNVFLDATAMTNIQQGVDVVRSDNTGGFPLTSDATYDYYTIPLRLGSTVVISASANTNPGGGAYTRTALFAVSCEAAFGSALTHYIASSTIFAPVSGGVTVPAMAIGVDFDTPGGGTTSLDTAISEHAVVISVPVAYASYGIRVDYKN